MQTLNYLISMLRTQKNAYHNYHNYGWEAIQRELLETWAHFYKHGLTLIAALISNYMPSKVWDEITYPFLNFKRLHRWSLGMEK